MTKLESNVAYVSQFISSCVESNPTPHEVSDLCYVDTGITVDSVFTEDESYVLVTDTETGENVRVEV